LKSELTVWFANTPFQMICQDTELSTWNFFLDFWGSTLLNLDKSTLLNLDYAAADKLIPLAILSSSARIHQLGLCFSTLLYFHFLFFACALPGRLLFLY